MKKLLRISFLTATIGFSTGCATIVSKSEYPVNITSNPTGVAFEIKNRAGKIVTHGTTPQNVVLKAVIDSYNSFYDEWYNTTKCCTKSGCWLF
ncbi:hypothetical protein [Rodentibacter pneumotropicus]|uniref:hypothetical protein n=1 Tax=Rodentibacter pneumotropicus TaxID=758 RepID=UPI002119F37E|nr:hypothetical protein [Rodentibacter pneumotropicus]